MRLGIAACLIILGFWQVSGNAQEKGQPEEQTALAAKHLISVLQMMESHLQKDQSYQVTVTVDWHTSGTDKKSEGTNSYKFWKSKDGKFRIEVQSSKQKAPGLICVYDGKKIVRYYAPSQIYSEEITNDPEHAVQNCAITSKSLDGSGIDLLLRKDFVNYTVGHFAQLVDKGEEVKNGNKVQVFSGLWQGKRTIEFWFNTGKEPLLRGFHSVLSIPINADKTLTFDSRAKLSWSENTDIPEKKFTLAIPANAAKVNDLLTAMLKGGSDQLVGKKLPSVTLQRLGGKKTKLSAAPNAKVNVFFFWASWCAPSTDDLPNIRTRMNELRKKGVVFTTINVGEEPTKVQEFVSKSKWQAPVLVDTDSTAMQAFHLTALPTTVIVDSNGMVVSVRVGLTQETRQQISDDIRGLLKD